LWIVDMSNFLDKFDCNWKSQGEISCQEMPPS
jgi:hypothetical protein